MRLSQILLIFSLTSFSLCHLRPRDSVPNFSALAVKGDDVSKVSFDDYKGKYMVLIFYPLDFTYVCPTELIAFSDKISEFEALETTVFGISTDSHFSHMAWIKTDRKQGGVGHLNYPLIADFSKKISRTFGFLVEDENDELNGAALRGLVIVGPDGVIRHVQINDAPVGRSVDEVIRLIQAFKHSDKNGVVCPANWKPGKNTIKPDPNDKLEYFNKEF